MKTRKALSGLLVMALLLSTLLGMNIEASAGQKVSEDQIRELYVVK